MQNKSNIIEHNIVLASVSVGRAKICADVGLNLGRGIDSGVDENAIKNNMKNDSAKNIALELAKVKACAVSNNMADTYVIGGDQTLSLKIEVDGKVVVKKFDKPNTLDGVKNHLIVFSGKTHTLHSGVAIALNGKVLWSQVVDAHMTVRELSISFIDEYVLSCGDKVKSSIGGYHFEELGAQLFEKVDGDYFTIIGLPLFDTLNFLRTEGVIS